VTYSLNYLFLYLFMVHAINLEMTLWISDYLKTNFSTDFGYWRVSYFTHSLKFSTLYYTLRKSYCLSSTLIPLNFIQYGSYSSNHWTVRARRYKSINETWNDNIFWSTIVPVANNPQENTNWFIDQNGNRYERHFSRYKVVGGLLDEEEIKEIRREKVRDSLPCRLHTYIPEYFDVARTYWCIWSNECVAYLYIVWSM
jgi:hypothetical protein